MDTKSPAYARAFQHYLRSGASIPLLLKSEQPSTHYIWRTAGDSKVRDSHRANDGKVFAWDTPPATGHPGEDYGCRCTAAPYLPRVQEYISFDFLDVPPGTSRLSNTPFIAHYYIGGFRQVRFRDYADLMPVVGEYMKQAGDRIRSNHIVGPARAAPRGHFSDDFFDVYPMKHVIFTLGNTTIGGDLSGVVTERAGILDVSGRISFWLKDEFADPLNEEIEVGFPYDIYDFWEARFEGQFYKDGSRSKFAPKSAD